MNTEKNCCFQYATMNAIKHDSGPIDRKTAQEMFDSNKIQFRHDLAAGLDPEMALWINMTDADSFGETADWWTSDEFIIHQGEMYRKV